MAEKMIELKHGVKIYNENRPNQVYALREMDLSVESGDAIAIMGVSGSGKTTLLNVLGCLDILTRGSYLLAGQNVSGLKGAPLAMVRNSTVGYVLQEYGLLTNDTVTENVELPLYFSGKYKGSQAKARVMKCLMDMGIEDKAGEKVCNLSGGQMQRVAIARAMVNDPLLLLADEPTGALDSATAEEIMDIFVRLNREKNKTVIMVTHDANVAAKMNRILFIKDGKIQEN